MGVDPIVAETRKVREEHAAKFNYNLEAIYHDLKEHEQRTRYKVVSLSPKRPVQPTKTRGEFAPTPDMRLHSTASLSDG